MRVEQSEPRCKAELCSLLGYSRQSYYQRLKETEKEGLGVALISKEVIRIRKDQRRVGTRKLLLMLKDFMEQHQIKMGRDKLFDLLKAEGLLIRRRRCTKPRTTFSNHRFKKHPNLIEEFVPQAAEQLWVSDITYVPAGKHFSYLSLITDAYSRKIVGYYLSKDLSAKGCVKALEMALQQRLNSSALIHHSDRGGQYCSVDYVDMLQENEVSISMTQSGDPRENAIAERVNGILKTELFEKSYNNFQAAVEHVSASILIYNTKRLHSSINMLTPQKAHHLEGSIKKVWKNYRAKRKEVEVESV